MRGLAFLALLTACGNRAATSVPPGPTPSPTPAPPPFVVVDGAWTRETLGGAVTTAQGLRADDNGVAMIIDAGPTLMTRAPGGVWESHALIDATVIYGEITGAAILLVMFDPNAVTSELVYVRGGHEETIADGCDVMVFGSVHLIAPDVITYQCSQDRVVARRGAHGWETIATPPSMLVSGAAGDDGAIYLLDATLQEPVDFFVIRDGQVTASTVPEVDVGGGIATCGGAVYATFEQDGGTALGRFDGTAWQLETVQTASAGAGTLALDEACHPFVAVADQVYSRAATGWIASSVGGFVKQLAAHDGHLYATYDEVTDSVHAGFAEARLR